MEAFETKGIFWLAGAPDRTLAGMLSFDPAEGANLELYGILSAADSVFGSQSQPSEKLRIHGNTSLGPVTLEGCWSTGYSLSFGGPETESFYVGYVLAGACLPEDSNLEFDAMAVAFEQLATWVRRGSLEFQVDTMEPDGLGTATEVRIRYVVPREESVKFDEDKISLKPGWSTNFEALTSAGIKQEPFFVIDYGRQKELQYLLLDMNGLQDLVTLAADSAVAPSEIKLWKNDLKRKSGDRELPVALKLYAANIAEHGRTGARKSRLDTLFEFDAIGGLETAARWLQVSRQYRTVLGGLLTIKYSPRLYEENRYSNVLTAAEAFHRLRFSNEIIPASDAKARRRKIIKTVKREMGGGISHWLNDQLLFSNEPRLRHRLAELAEYAGESFGSIVGAVDEWLFVAAGIRNRLTHHDEKQPLHRQPGDVHFLAESVYVLVMLCLLRECGVSPTRFSKVAQNPKIGYLRSRIDEIVPRAAQSLRRR